MEGILNILKPAGMSSFSVVAKVRKLLGVKKAGHTGTLDPEAQGVLPICIGKATKTIEFLTLDDKEYICTMALGRSTTTQDAEGETINIGDVRKISPKDIVDVLYSMIGEISQLPPMYSAVKVNGKRLYQLAREGIEVERKTRNIKIYDIEIYSIEQNEEKFNFEDTINFKTNDEVKVSCRIACSKGTYIRTLCNDVGEKLAVYGYMESLFRSKVGNFSHETAITLDELEKYVNEGQLDDHIIKCEDVLSELESIVVEDKDLQGILCGQKKRISCEYDADKKYRLFDTDMKFLGIGEILETEKSKLLKMYKMF